MGRTCPIVAGTYRRLARPFLLALLMFLLLTHHSHHGPSLVLLVSGTRKEISDDSEELGLTSGFRRVVR